MNPLGETLAGPLWAEEGILRGLHRVRESALPDGPRVQLLGAGTILSNFRHDGAAISIRGRSSSAIRASIPEAQAAEARRVADIKVLVKLLIVMVLCIFL